MRYPGGGLREQLAHVGAEAVRAGLVVGSGGNLSAREPGSDECWITAANTWLDRLEPAGFSLISIPDGALRGGHPNPSSEWRLHAETYVRRPDVNAIVHLHPQTSVLLTALGYDIALTTTDHAYYLREVAAVPFDQPGTAELAVAAAEAVAGGINALVLGHTAAPCWPTRSSLRTSGRSTWRRPPARPTRRCCSRPATPGGSRRSRRASSGPSVWARPRYERGVAMSEVSP